MFEKRSLITVDKNDVDEDALLETVLESGGEDYLEEDDVYENLKFVNKDLPHKTLDKLITFFEQTEEYEKCSKLQKIKHTRLSEYTKYNL